MDETIAKKYQKAGKILKEAQEKAKKKAKSGVNLLELAETIEKFVESKGAKPAFPVNLSTNNNAAHQTPALGEMTTLQKEDVVKIDIGAHIDGYIADSSFTLNLSGDYKDLIKATDEALKNAIKAVEDDLDLGQTGKIIQDTIKSHGFNPVQNLSGHGLMRYMQHAPPSIPNIEKNDERGFENDHVYAIEPFATDGVGFVKEGTVSEIYMIEEERNVRNPYARKILEFVEKEYQGLPFAERWLQKLKLSEFQLKVGLKSLMQEKILKSFPILHEDPGKIVSQSENSVLIFEEKVITLVK